MSAKPRDPSRQQFAKKSLGQNFLSDPNYLRKIVSSLGLEQGEKVIEIGPGRGALTRLMLECGAAVTAIEIDSDLYPVLDEEFGASERFTLVEGDALKVDFEDLCSGQKAKLAANLPYYISTAILQRLIAYRGSFTQLVVMLQREVVERITAKAGDSERGFISVMVEAYFEVENLFDVPPSAFRPAPKVWSAVARLTPRAGTEDTPTYDSFRRVVSAGFAQRRKTIANNLKASGLFGSPEELQSALSRSGVDPGRRAETLTVDEWKLLASSI